MGYVSAGVLLYQTIADATVIDRSGRREPRCLKRRPKPYQLMSVPRALMVEMTHREKIVAKRFKLVPFEPDFFFLSTNLKERHLSLKVGATQMEYLMRMLNHLKL